MGFLEISSELNTEGRKLPVGKVLIFDFEGSPVYLKIMKKVGGKVFAKRLKPELFLTPEQADQRIVITKKNN